MNQTNQTNQHDDTPDYFANRAADADDNDKAITDLGNAIFYTALKYKAADYLGNDTDTAKQLCFIAAWRVLTKGYEHPIAAGLRAARNAYLNSLRHRDNDLTFCERDNYSETDMAMIALDTVWVDYADLLSDDEREFVNCLRANDLDKTAEIYGTSKRTIYRRINDICTKIGI